MGRPKKSAPKHVEPEYESQDVPDEEPAAVIEPEPADEPEGDAPNKSEAARQAIKAGYEKPGEAVAWIKSNFGIDMGPQHFSGIKSNYKKAQAAAAPAKSKPGRKPRETAPLVEGYVAPPEKPKSPANGETDLLAAMEAMKPLVARLGVEKVHRLVDLLG